MAMIVLRMMVVVVCMQGEALGVMGLRSLARVNFPLVMSEPKVIEHGSEEDECSGFMSFNVWNFQDGKEWGKRLLDQVEIIKSFAPCFIGLNEMRAFDDPTKGNMFGDYADHLARLGYRGGFQAGMKYVDQGLVEGLAFFTMFDFDEDKVEARHLHHDDDDVADRNKRICVHVPLKNGFDVYLTHFSYAPSDQVDNANGVIEFIGSTRSNDSKVVLLGDFNVIESNPQSREAMEILESQARLVDSWKHINEPSSTNGWTYCNCKYELPYPSSCRDEKLRIDRIFVSAQLAPSIHQVLVGPQGSGENSLCPSDHRCVVLYFDHYRIK